MGFSLEGLKVGTVGAGSNARLVGPTRKRPAPVFKQLLLQHDFFFTPSLLDRLAFSYSPLAFFALVKAILSALGSCACTAVCTTMARCTIVQSNCND